MQRIGQLRVADELGKLPQVNFIGQNSTVGDDIAIDIRGLKASETQVMLDGHPIGPLGVYPGDIGGGQGGFDFQVGPMFALQNTVLTFGSGATGLYGVDAVGGAIDLQTISPTETRQGLIKLGYGGQGRQFTDVQATGTVGKLGYVFLHGVNGAYGNFPGALIPQTGARGNDFTSATLAADTYFVSGNYILRNDLAKLVYKFSPITSLSLTGYAANSWDDKTGEGDNDFITYDYALFQAASSPNCSLTPGGPMNGVTVITDSAPNGTCVTPQQYAKGASGPAGGGQGPFQWLRNQDYHARLTTAVGRNQIIFDSFLDNYGQLRERPPSNINGDLSILYRTYRTVGMLASDDIVFAKNDVGFGLYSQRQYTTGQNVSGTTVTPSDPLFAKLDSFFIRDVWEPPGRVSYFLNAWYKHSLLGGNSFDPRVTVMFRPTPADVIRLTGGKSSADPAPIAAILTGAGGINPHNCQTFGLGQLPTSGERAEKSTDLEVALGHRFGTDTSLQFTAYDTNENDTIFELDQPAANYVSLINTLGGPGYLNSVASHVQSICPNFAPPNPPPTIANYTITSNVNLATARARGMEVDGRFRALPNLLVGGYWNAQSVAVFNAPVDLLTINPTLIPGSQLPIIPLHKWGVNFDLTNTHGGEVYLEYTHWDGNNALARAAYGEVDGSFTQRVSNNLSLSMGVINLLNNDVDDYGRIGLGVFVPENQFGTDPNGLAQGSERFGLVPMTVTFSVTQKI
jgi:outer membrane receptor protein involved in Fe transport